LKYVPDPTGRFVERPFYEAAEIDQECETLVQQYLSQRYGSALRPLSTDDLTILIERAGAVLDSSVDLSTFGANVEGMTIFTAEREPEVRISDRLAGDAVRINRHRMTLAHEFAHVHFHGPLYAIKFGTTQFAFAPREERIVCGADTITDAPVSNWIEWQAAYAGGALLMPKTRIGSTVRAYRERHSVGGDIFIGSPKAAELGAVVCREFVVSPDAARVRLEKLRFIVPDDGQTGFSF